MVTADSQSAGRGRGTRSWFAPPGSALLYSVLIRDAADHPLLPLLVPLAVCDTAEAIAAVECSVKWPNDVWIEGRKLAGVLIEGRADKEPAQRWAVVGVGLNIDFSDVPLPEDLQDHVAWLGEGLETERVLDLLNMSLARWLAAGPDEVLDDFRSRDLLLDQRLEWEGGEGVARGIDDSGHLLVETAEGAVVEIGAGEVTLGAFLRENSKR